MGGDAARVDVDAVMAELHSRVRERLRGQLVEAGTEAFDDPALFAAVEGVLHAAASTPETARLILPELLGEPDTWRLTTKMRYGSHRGAGAASVVRFVKQRVLMPLLRWMYEYSRDNFERQRRTNHVLFACVQELAVETALLRREVHRLSTPAPHSAAASMSETPSSGAATHSNSPRR
ncbi:MAG TPA: hypothetical protein VIK60_12255 [Vicinamibacterales bacterium]